MGKIKARIKVANGAPNNEVEAKALEAAGVESAKKVIVVPNRLVNIVL